MFYLFYSNVLYTTLFISVSRLGHRNRSGVVQETEGSVGSGFQAQLTFSTFPSFDCS